MNSLQDCERSRVERLHADADAIDPRLTEQLHLLHPLLLLIITHLLLHCLYLRP